MTAKLDIGRSYSLQSRVEEWMTAEKAAVHCIEPVLGGGEVTLGTHIDLAHHKPVPVGFIVRTEVEVVMIDGPRVSFAVQVFDEREAVAEGTPASPARAAGGAIGCSRKETAGLRPEPRPLGGFAPDAS